MKLNICWGVGVGLDSNSPIIFLQYILCGINSNVYWGGGFFCFVFLSGFTKRTTTGKGKYLSLKKAGSKYAVYDSNSRSTDEIISEIVSLFLRVKCSFGLVYKSL